MANFGVDTKPRLNLINAAMRAALPLFPMDSSLFTLASCSKDDIFFFVPLFPCMDGNRYEYDPQKSGAHPPTTMGLQTCAPVVNTDANPSAAGKKTSTRL